MVEYFGGIGKLVVVGILAVALLVGGTMFYGGVLNNYDVSYDNASTQTGAGNIYLRLNSSVNTVAGNIQQSSAYDNPFVVIFNGAVNGVMQSFVILDTMKDFLGLSGIYLASLGIDANWFINGFLIVLLGVFVAWLILQVGLNRQV